MKNLILVLLTSILLINCESTVSSPEKIDYKESAATDYPVEGPSQLSLDQNYPNPFNVSTKIKVGIPYESHVKLSVYSAEWTHIETLVDESIKEGFYTYLFFSKDKDGNNLPSGTYYYVLEACEIRIIKEMKILF